MENIKRIMEWWWYLDKKRDDGKSMEAAGGKRISISVTRTSRT